MAQRNISLLALALALGVVLGTARKASSLGSPDFKVFYTAARHAMVDPENIYKLSPDRYLYPPSTAIVLTPFAFTDHFAFHQWVWQGLLAACLFALAALSAPALASMALLVRYLAITFSYGQINLVVMSLLAISAWSTARRRPGPAGAIWALATSLKVYPLVLAPFFFPRGRRGALAAAALGATILLAMPFALYGLDLGRELYVEFFGALRAKGLPLHSHNQSFAALLLRLFTHQEFYLHAVGPARWGILDLPVEWLRGAAWLAGGSLTFLSWRRAWGRGLNADAALAAAAFSILFLSHIVWKDYLLFLYFPLRELFARGPRPYVLWIAGIFIALITLSSPDVVGHPLSTKLDAACIHLWAAVLIWGAWWKEA